MIAKREEYDIPDDVTYLNCAFMSLLSKKVTELGLSSLKVKQKPWLVKTEDFFTIIESAKKEYARLIKTSINNIALIPSVSYGLAIAEKNLPVKGGGVLVLEDQFPSNFYIWKNWCKQNNKKLEIIPKRKGTSISDEIIKKIDSNLSAVAIPQVHWCDGVKIDLQEISKACKHYEVPLIVDGTQSVGAMPFLIPEIQPDFLIVANYKWMMGPYSLAFAYIDPKYHNGKPLEYGWLNKKGSDNFKNLVNYQDDFIDGAVKFDMGQKSNFALLPMATLAAREINEIGVENISSHINCLNEYFLTFFAEEKLNIWPKKLRSPHILGIDFGSSVLVEKLNNKFLSEKIYISFRGNTLRISPNIYNTKSDMEKLARVLIMHWN